MSTLSIRVDEKTMRELRRISREEHVAISDFVRDSLQKSILAERFKITRSKALPFAEMQGLITDEDIFAALK